MLRSHIRPWLAATTPYLKRSFQSTHISRVNSRGDVELNLSSAEDDWEISSTNVSQKYQKLGGADDWQELQNIRLQRKLLVDLFTEYGSTQTRDTAFQPHHSLHRALSPSEATLSALLASGAHFGHSRSLLNPNFMPYAYGVRAGITIIDLDRTLPLLRRAANLVRAITHRDGTVVFIGTRPDLRPVVRKAAERVGERQGYYVGERWLPGTLTNKLQMFGPDVVKEEKVVPDLVVILNPLANMNAIRECAIEHVPTIGIIDSNVDPRIVMYPIPANDESVRTAELVAGVLSIAGREGVAMRKAEELRRAEKEKRSGYNTRTQESKRWDNSYDY